MRKPTKAYRARSGAKKRIRKGVGTTSRASRAKARISKRYYPK